MADLDKSQKEIIQEFSRSIRKKFVTEKDKRELNDMLQAFKFYLLEKLIEKILLTIDLESIEIQNENDLGEGALTDMLYDVQKKLKLNRIIITGRNLARIERATEVLRKIFRIVIFELLRKHPDNRTKIISAIRGEMEAYAYLEGMDFDDLPKDLKLENLPAKLYKDEISIEITSTNPPPSLITENPTKSPDDFYYWNDKVERMEFLKSLLVKHEFIFDTPLFNDCFNRRSKLAQKDLISWRGTRPELYFLLYRLYGNNNVYKNEHINKIAGTIFTFYKLKNDETVLNSSYTKFMKKVSGKYFNEYIKSKLKRINQVILEFGL